MPHYSKIIAMFAVLIIHIPQNAGSKLAFSVQAFFMPGHIVYHIWYPCTPVWSVNAPTAFCGCDKQRERHGYFHFKNLLLCLTMQKFPPLPQTASERPPTKRVSTSPHSPLTSISTVWELICKVSPSIFFASAVRTVLPSPVCSISVASTIRSVLKTMSTCWSICWNDTGRNVLTIRGAGNGNVSGTCFRSSTVIRTPWYFRHTFPDLHLSHQLYALFPVAIPSGINAFLYSDLRTFHSVSSPWYLMILPYSIPRTPWNEKTSNIEGVLKRKYFKRGIQQSNRPTRERILKCNSLLYSIIYFLFNHIYILQWRCLVGRCWTCWIAIFQPSNWLRPTKTAKNAACWTCWTSSNSIFFIVNLYN